MKTSIELKAVTGPASRHQRPHLCAQFSAVFASLALVTTANAGPTVAPTFANNFRFVSSITTSGTPTQMAWGPDGRLYVASDSTRVNSYAYDWMSGKLSDERTAVTGISCLGIAFQGATMYLSSTNGNLYRLRDQNHNGIYGEPGETNVAIVTGIPQGDHNLDNLQIVGDTLYMGIGRRTINGHSGDWTSGSLDDYGGKGFWSGGLGDTFGDCAYGGTIGWIQNLNLVPDTTSAANAYSNTTITQSFIQLDASPLGTNPAKLMVHSAGTRNPFGLALDKDGNLYFTNNFNRVASNGDGTAGFGLDGDVFSDDFSNNVYDQFFKASYGADYGYTDVNWRGVNPMLTTSNPSYHRQNSITYDQLFNPGPYVFYDVENPIGLGPSPSADGVAFWYSPNLPVALQGNAFIARYNTSITEAPGGLQRTINYGDVVTVNPTSGKVRRVAYGFTSALAVLPDGHDHLLIADYNPAGTSGGAIYTLHALRTVP